MEGRPAFMQLIERNERRESLGPMRESSGMRPVRKIKVKALKGSPYVISLEKSDLVGEGSYGSVVRVFDLDNRDEELVAKVIPLDDKLKLAAIEAELRILIRLPLHPNLVNYKKIRVSSADKQYFIMEYCNGGTLNRLLNQSSPITNEEILEFLGQFSRGYKVLYQSGIIHRDIKPENILIHNKYYKIADFGLAKIVDSLNIQSISAKGTPLYIAPELVRREKSSAKVDMWSLGVILYRLLFEGRFPFLVSSIDYDVQTALRHIQDKPLIIPESPKRPEELINLLKLMLEKDESKRISWEQFFENSLIYPYIQTEQPDLEEKLSSGSGSKKASYNPMKLYASSRVMQVDKTEEVQQINMADSLESIDRLMPINTNKELHKTADSTPKSSNSSQKSQFKDSSSQKETNQATPSRNTFLSDEKPSGYSATRQRISDSVRNIVNNGKRLLNIKEGLEKANEGTVHHKQVLKNHTNILGNEDEDEEHLSIREKALFFDRVALRLMAMEDLLNTNKSLENMLIQYLPMSQRATILLISAAQLVNSQLLQRITQKATKVNKPAVSPLKFHKSSFSICSFDITFNSAQKNPPPTSHNQQIRNSSLITSTHSETLKQTTQPLSIMLLQDQQWLNTLKQDFIEESGPPDLDKKAYAKRISTLNAEQVARALTITVQAMTPLFEGIYKLSSQHSRGLLILFSYLLKAKELCLSEQPLEELSHCHQYWKFYEEIETKRSEEVLFNELSVQIHVEEHKKFQFLNDMRDNEYKK